MDKEKRISSVGGQAVLEGVMMKSPHTMAIAVRREDGTIDVRTEPVKSPAAKHKWLGWPIVRGVVNFVQMLIIGMRSLSMSADMMGLEEEEPTAFEKALAKIFHKKATDVMMAVAVTLSVALAAGLFIALPSLVGYGLQRFVQAPLIINLLEGLTRIILFVGYILLVSKMEEIQRVFMYHGAEHKTIHCYEHEQELTPENAAAFTRLHPRCGTSFLLIVMVISILFFSLLGAAGLMNSYFLRVGLRLLLMPLVAGISYEVLKLLAKSNSAFCRALRWPGIQMQRLTTKEPDMKMLEVAIASFKAAMGQPWQTDEGADTQKPGPNAQPSEKNGAPIAAVEYDAPIGPELVEKAHEPETDQEKGAGFPNPAEARPEGGSTND